MIHVAVLEAWNTLPTPSPPTTPPFSALHRTGELRCYCEGGKLREGEMDGEGEAGIERGGMRLLLMIDMRVVQMFWR